MTRRTCAAAVLLLLVACSSSPTTARSAAGPSGPAAASTTAGPAAAAQPPAGGGIPAVPLPRPADVDRRDPDAVARAALTALYSYDTAVDQGPADAARRALPWLSDGFTRTILATPPTAPPDATWTAWARHRAVVTPQLTAGHDDRPAETAGTTHRQYTVERWPRGRDGWHGRPNRSVAFVLLIRGRDGWSVDKVVTR